MFEGYKVVNDTLYLYIDFNYEIGKFIKNKNNKNIINSIKEYIKSKKIKFNGYKVILIASGIIVGSIFLNKPVNNSSKINNEYKYVYNIVDKSVPIINYKKNEVSLNDNIVEDKQEILSDASNNNIVKKSINSNNTVVKNNKIVIFESSDTTNTNEPIQTNTNDDVSSNVNEKLITLKRSNGQIITLSLNDYLIGVVAAEMPASFNSEALKAQSVVARTYTYKLLEYNKVITDDVSTQVYKDNNELKNIWNTSYNTYYEKIRKAVLDTDGEVIMYNDSLIDAVYHAASNGYTEDSINVWGNSYPYLKTVSSNWDINSTSYLRSVNISYEELSSKLNYEININSTFNIISKNESNRISKIEIDGNTYTGVFLRNLLGLRSADFDIEKNKLGVTFTTRGYGHGVGMSQYGANGMAKEGYNYKQILNYYYTNVYIVKK